MKYALIVGAILIAQVSPATAQRIGTVMGVGTIGCGQYLEHRKGRSQDDLYYTWAWGFISAYNMFSKHPQVDAPDPPTVLAYLDRYCSEKPLDKVVAGTLSLIADSGGWAAKRDKSTP